MQAIIDACDEGRLEAVPCAVVSNNGDAEALVRARRHGIAAYHLSAGTHPVPDDLDAEILKVLRAHAADLLVLAGYLRKVGPRTLEAYRGRILNIHPALLPKFGGRGMFGLRVHEAVLRAGDRETGVTVHLADQEYDHGPILAQCRIPVLANDTPERLANRVLEREHQFFVEVLQRIAAGGISLPARMEAP